MVKRKRLSSTSISDEKTPTNEMTLDESCLQVSTTLVKSSSSNPNNNFPGSPPPVETKSSSKQTTSLESPKDINLDDVNDKRTKIQTGPTLRSSLRVQKRSRQDDSPQTLQAQTKQAANEVSTPEQVKSRRSWELWSVDDKNTFFEALCEFGKDFESIQNYIAQKNKKKGITPQMIKNKDQVRHFYYRTWHKISKYLDISSDIKKQTQELYGLINYGELRKKIGRCLDTKNGLKLNELVHKGATTLRYKGKNLRVKTPLCRALKKLNFIKECKGEQPKLPARVTVEIRPKTNKAWAFVQSLSQNPRVRMTLTLQRRLSTVIDYLQRKWRPQVLKQRDLLQGSNSKVAEDGVVSDNRTLRLLPRSDANITMIDVKFGSEVSSASVSLQNYREKILMQPSFESKKNCKEKLLKGNLPSSSGNELRTLSDELKAGAVQSDSPAGSKSTAITSTATGTTNTTTTITTTTAATTTDTKSTASVPNAEKENCTEEVIECPEKSHLGESSNSLPSHEITLRQLLALQTAVDSPCSSNGKNSVFKTHLTFLTSDNSEGGDKVQNLSVMTNESVVTSVESDKADDKPVPIDPAEHAIEVEKIKKGWTAGNAETLTIGEIFIMLGCPKKLYLDFDWDEVVSHNAEEQTCSSNDLKISPNISNFNLVLNKLVQLASTTFLDIKNKNDNKQVNQVQCHCGSSPSNKLSKASGSKSQKSSGSSKNAALSSANSVSQPLPRKNTKDVSSSTADILEKPVVSEANEDIFLKPTGGAPHGRIINNKNLDSNSTQNSNNSAISSEKAFKEQLNKLMPPSRKARGRVGKQVVVQRELPLLPKTSPMHSMMTLQIVPTASQLAGSFMPVLTNPTNNVSNSSSVTNVVKFAPGISNTVVATPNRPSINNPTTSLVSIPVPAGRSQIGVLAKTRTINASAVSSTTLTSKITSPSPVLGSVTGADLVVLSPSAQSDTEQSKVNFNNLRNQSSSLLLLASTSLTGSTTKLRRDVPLSELCISEPTSTVSISPPSISSLLEISLPCADGIPSESASSESTSDKLLDFTLGNSSCTFTDLISLSPNSSNKVSSSNSNKSLLELNEISTSSMDSNPQQPICTSPRPHVRYKVSSPGPEGVWLGGDAVDLSLSSLLGHFDSSPAKAPSLITNTLSNPQPTEDSIGRLNSDVDSHLQSIMSENSLDYMSKFADLAAHIENSDIHKI